jgi:phosphoserine phosphatase
MVNDAYRAARLPLVVDFDGTLCRTDTLAWLRERCGAHSPAAEAERLAQLSISKQAEKIYLWREFGMHPNQIPFDTEVLAWAQARSEDGRELFLATGSAHDLAWVVSEHLGLFAGAWGSTLDVNLTGSSKAAMLVAEFGTGGFDYVGDSSADLPLWAAARQGYCVTRGQDLGFELPATVITIPSRLGLLRCPVAQ